MGNEKVIKKYYGGYEKKDWNSVENLLADDFSFTSPNNDDHIGIEKFKEKCWPEADKIERFDVDKVFENGDEAFVRYQCWTTSGKSFRNTEYFRFGNGKIKEIEVFFGTGQGFASNAVNQ
jgi:ketosteroid isomerase-like protein